MVIIILLTCLFLMIMYHCVVYYGRSGRLINQIPGCIHLPIPGKGLRICWYSPGAKWHKRRKILTPAFHFSILKEFVKTLIEEGNRAVKSFNPAEESIIEDVMLFTSHHMLNAICETSMGISLNDSDQSQQYRQTIHHMGKLVVNRFFKPWLFIDTIFNLTSQSTTQSKYLNILHSFTEKVNQIRNTFRSVEINNIGIIFFFVFVDGHDTVATSLCFSLLLLAEHKDIQDRVRNEINEVMQENNGKLTMNALQNLPYLERCLKESLRLYPSVTFISRLCTTDLKLQSYIIPKDTTMHLFIYCLHHDPNFWPDPEVFDPDRFLPENIQKRHPYSYVPFSAGLRNCIGQRFAMLELKAMIASLVYNFYLEPVDYLKDVSFKLDIVLRTSRPIRMKVIPIKRE
ncbi:Cytochrome P450 4C1 [Harpegnathos saltator]|uniref:Cytochrome P450 4C1 n=1 Tax=Harpegnathos saltator TaxID=610380 RepID=E2BDV3_HARSA|nr:Cytochrome P450 4C1 [Harpegnathos saltator]